VTRLVLRRPPGSRLRQVFLRNTFRLVLEAANRGDYEAAFALMPPDYETITPPELVGLGFDPVFRGREGRLRLQQQWIGELSGFENEPEELIDLGDRLLLLGRMRAAGAGSGVRFDSEVAYLITVSDGRMIGEQIFRSHEEALEAAGVISEIARPR